MFDSFGPFVYPFYTYSPCLRLVCFLSTFGLFDLLSFKVIAVKSMVAGHLSLLLRDVLTMRLQKYYFGAKHFYTINNLIDMDNPDQRFTQDVGIVCNLLAEIVPVIVINPFLVIFYTYKCVDKAGWLGPLSAYVMFIVFAILTRLLTTWTSKSIYEMERQEGNFRFVHTQLRCSSESAAFLNVGRSEQYFITIAFRRLLHAFRVSVNRKAVLLFITTMSAYTGAILNYLTLGVVLFSGYFGPMTSMEITMLISQIQCDARCHPTGSVPLDTIDSVDRARLFHLFNFMFRSHVCHELADLIVMALPGGLEVTDSCYALLLPLDNVQPVYPGVDTIASDGLVLRIEVRFIRHYHQT
ncbi:ATP-binding cassette, subfamily D (ALD), member 4 [Paragonimus westermani]|uniref:ATP-binding cassette, subfamily D (ALD), member 4 n=1 Tax=Paragonimus westermani TaxID=34504 RepID=A0A5J4N6Z1_9TREM|nr:ATP-binding cassette, subfamily D (ALD), member 4 [Paragonimus westermani]